MYSPFQIAAPTLHATGYSTIPLHPREKYPVIERWSEFCERLPTEDDHARWLKLPAANVGVCLGPASGVIALDFDDDVDGLHARIQALVPESPVAKRGAKGFTAFYRFTGERSHGYSVNGTRVLDVLSGGRQTVLPPSLHPSGTEYRWVTRLKLSDVAAPDLPAIPADAMAAVIRLFRPEPAPLPRPAWSKPADDDTTPEDIAEALQFIPADDYNLWINIGMALRQHLGDAGLPVWDRWSSGSGKYDAKEIPGKWRSFNRSDLKIGTLFHEAMNRGYVRSTPRRPDVPPVVIEEGGNLRPVPRTLKPSLSSDLPPSTPSFPRTPSEPDADPLNPPGLVGRIARWINDTAIYPQPALAVSAAIALAGAVMAHKVQSPTRLRTNFYTLGLAPSGAGKDHARKCVVNLLRYAGLDGYLGGEPASGAGLLTAIREGGGKCLIQWDEFGRVLRMLTHKNAGSHQADILRYLVDLFSSAGSIYAGVQYADHDGKMKRKPIDQPCLCVYGTTVPERFFQCLTSDDAIDGFLARFLVMESRDYGEEEAEPAADINDPPESLLDELRRWKEAPSNYDPKGNLDGALRIFPMVVSYAPDAQDLIKNYTRHMRRRTAEESQRRTGLAAIFARAAEHAVKLALVAHEGETIDLPAMRWGIATANWCAGFIAEAVAQNVANNDFERAGKKLLAVIREAGGGWLPHKSLTGRSQDLNARQRSEILTNLADAGLIEIMKERTEGADKPTTYYRVA